MTDCEDPPGQPEPAGGDNPERTSPAGYKNIEATSSAEPVLTPDHSAAIEFASRYQINVIPIKPRDKAPAVKWTAYQTRVSTAEERGGWLMDKKINLGFVLGKTSGGLFVIDVDHGQLFQKILDELDERTPIIRTGHPSGGHYQIYLRATKEFKRRKFGFFGPGLKPEGEELVTIKGQGDQAVAIGSLHPSGRLYKVVEDPGRIAQVDDIDEFLSALGAKIRIWGLELGFRLEQLATQKQLDRLMILVREHLGATDDAEVKLYLCNKYGVPSRKLLTAKEVATEIGGLSSQEKGERGFDPKACAEYLLDKYRFATFEDTREVHVYKDGVFVPHGEAVILAEAHSYLLREEERATRFKANEVVAFIQRSSFVKRSVFGGPLDLVNLQNGVLNIETGEFLPHSPDYRFLAKLPVDYDPTATCPKIMGFLGDILRPEDLPTLQEAMGYCLLREYLFHKAFMFVGKGGNGKSKLLGLNQALLGGENCSSISLQSISYNRFAVAELYRKTANICADLPSSKITNSGIFKMLTGGDRITAEKKGCDPFEFVNHAKLFFSANAIPETTDETDAYYDRWVILDFPNVIRGTDRDDPKILEKLTTPEELSGFLNWVLDGLRRLLAKNRFSNNRTTDEVREDYLRKSNPVKAFAMDCLVADTNGTIPKDTLYAVYVAYCDQNQLQKHTNSVFFRDHLPRALPGVGRARLGAKGNRYQAITGVRLRTPEEEEDASESMSGVRSLVSGGQNGPLTPPMGGDQKTLENVGGVKDVRGPGIPPENNAKATNNLSRGGGSQAETREGTNNGVNTGIPDMPDTLDTSQPPPPKTILFTRKYESFADLDDKIYGPFTPQDVASIPEENARVIVAQGVGVYIDAPVGPQGQDPNNGHGRASLPQRDRLVAIYEIIETIERESGTAPMGEITREAMRRLGIGTLEVEQGIEKLKLDGHIFEPVAGRFKIVA